MNQLSTAQHELLLSITDQLRAISGIKAVVLGGSHARGRARTGSDIDLGLFYSEASPFSIQHIRELAESINDTANPVVTDFYGWGPWVNGGAWLTIGGQRVDFIYRSLEQVKQVIAEAEAGRYVLDYVQQPPFGFFSPTYLGEISICIPLFDADARLNALKQRIASYPEALRRAVVQDYLWQVEFNLAAFAQKFAARGDAYGTASCLTRAVNQLILVLFALNGQYLLNDKTALAEIAEFARAPQEFAARVQQTFASLGNSAAELDAAVKAAAQLFQETCVLADGLYTSRFALPM